MRIRIQCNLQNEASPCTHNKNLSSFSCKQNKYILYMNIYWEYFSYVRFFPEQCPTVASRDDLYNVS
jgi:hypothetical protein